MNQLRSALDTLVVCGACLGTTVRADLQRDDNAFDACFLRALRKQRFPSPKHAETSQMHIKSPRAAFRLNSIEYRDLMSSSSNTSFPVENLASILPQLARIAVDTIRLVQTIDPRILERLQSTQTQQLARASRNVKPCGTCSRAKVKVNSKRAVTA